MNEPWTRWVSSPQRSEEQRAHETRIHALRTPLTATILRVQLLRRRVGKGLDPSRLDGELEEIEQGLAELAAVITAIDRATRGDGGAMADQET